jgi:hypothetical protein
LAIIIPNTGNPTYIPYKTMFLVDGEEVVWLNICSFRGTKDALARAEALTVVNFDLIFVKILGQLMIMD